MGGAEAPIRWQSQYRARGANSSSLRPQLIRSGEYEIHMLPTPLPMGRSSRAYSPLIFSGKSTPSLLPGSETMAMRS